MVNVPSEFPAGGMMPMTEPTGPSAIAQPGLDILRVLRGERPTFPVNREVLK